MRNNKNRPKRSQLVDFLYAQAKAFLYLAILILGIVAIVLARKIWLTAAPHIP